MKHDTLKRLYQLEQRQPQSITVIAKNQNGNLHEMSVKDLIETQSEFIKVKSGGRLLDLDSILGYIMPSCVI